MGNANQIIYILWVLSVVILFSSCWLGEPGVEEKETLVGNYKIIVDLNGIEAGHTLSLNDDEGGYIIIKERCVSVYYDSTKIFVESLENYNLNIHKYCRLTNLNSTSPLYIVHELSREDFYRKVKECKNCIERHYPKP